MGIFRKWCEAAIQKIASQYRINLMPSLVILQCEEMLHGIQQVMHMVNMWDIILTLLTGDLGAY